MAYEVHNISQVTDVPALVGTFAAANGFDTDLTNPNIPRVTCPGDSNSVEENLTFTIQALLSGASNQDHSVWWSQGEPDSNSVTLDTQAIITSPKLASGAALPSTSLPTKVHIFGTAVATNSPFIAVVIEYGFNSYRHLYFGKMEAQGGYTGREVIAATGGPLTSTGAALDFADPQTSKYLFNGHSTLRGKLLSGGVRVIHADNAHEWRMFYTQTAITQTPLDEFIGDEAMGGFNDAINDGFLTRGRSSFTGINILVPINLYAAEAIVNDTSFVPLGRPPGVRMVHMQDLEPGTEIVVGNETWRVFPAARKTSAHATVPSVGWPVAETSVYIGYAYLEEDAP